MVNFTAEQFRGLMNHPTNIRNMSVIAHVDHGKTTLTDSLLKRAGIGSVGPKRELDTRQDEKERGITIKSTGISLHAELSDQDILDIQARQPTEGNQFLINLIDSPGHVDFSAEVTAALRVTDGALVVVDTVEGVSVQTETVLRQALAERIKPVMIINKVDRALLELKLSKEELYQSFRKTIESANAAIAPYVDPTIGDVQVHPNEGTVAFGAGKDGWAFTLRQFAMLAAKRFGVKKEKMMERLWGDNFYNHETHKWTKKSGNPEKERGFNMFVLAPIYNVFNTIMGGDEEKHASDPDVVALCEKLGVSMKGSSKEFKGKALLRDVMQKFLPAAEALLEMMIIHLPSPVVAQKYRAETLYEGPMDDRSAIAIRDCDASPNAPLMMYISKMVPSADRGRFFAFGRVFSGIVKAGLKVRIQGPDYIPGTKLQPRTIQRTVLMMGGKVEPLEDCPAGNICGLVGIDQFILKSATLTTDEAAHNMRVMKFSVSPVVNVAVSSVNVQDIGKFVEGLKRLSKSEPGILVKTTEAGEHIISGAGELQLEIALKDLEEDHAMVPIKKSNPIVQYRETVQTESSSVAMAKSSNKHNRIYMTARPLGEDLINDIESGKFNTRAEFKTRGRILADNYGWDVNQARKIFVFGPTDQDANVIVDATVGIDTREIRDSVVTAFTQTTLVGPLAGEQLRGVRFQIPDVKLHSDAIHRGMGQLYDPIRRSMLGAVLYAKPAIVEPYYLVDIQVHENAVGAVYSILTKKRGIVINEGQREGTPMKIVQAHLPVNESFGFNEDLRGATHGQAFPQMIFDHWEIMSGNPMDPNEKSGEVVRGIRVRKGMQPDVQPAEYYIDKL